MGGSSQGTIIGAIMKNPPPVYATASVVACSILLLSATATADDFCPEVYDQGVINTAFNPAFIDMDAPEHHTGELGLTVSSFVNFGRFGREPDLAARIEGLQCLQLDSSTQPPSFLGPFLQPPEFIAPTPGVEIITDQAPKTTWPNEATLAPEGMFSFPAVVVPQGFHVPLANPGRLTIINLNDHSEYLVHQSTQGAFGPTFPGDPNNSPRFYHRVLFQDMDGDGKLDLLTVRGGFRLRQGQPYPPFSELVYFKNPGAALNPQTPWQEVVLYRGERQVNPDPQQPAVDFLGPDIHLTAYRYHPQHAPLIVATHFFSSPLGGHIAIYGPPEGQTWANVNADLSNPARMTVISTGQGLPFDVQAVDLNMDGRLDILATNHQADNCAFATDKPGKIYALEGPALGKDNDADPAAPLFAGEWTTHVLKDEIYPQPSMRGARNSRLAPGRAQAFHPKKSDIGKKKPWIVAGGDQAAKVWVLKPQKKNDKTNWNYDSAVVFDINTHPAYAAVWGLSQGMSAPTQTDVEPSPNAELAISTIGSVGVGYQSPHGNAASRAVLYIPVFEGRKIHVLSFRGEGEPVMCSEDVREACF